MDILKLIKTRRTIRKYTNKPISKKILDKIIEAGIWGPSVVGIQPWKFIVITQKKMINKISDAILIKAQRSKAVVNIQLHTASNTIRSASVVIIVCRTSEFENISKRCSIVYSRFARIIKIAQFAAISAASQNMLLVAESLGVNSCWLDTPLLCTKEINKVIKGNEEIVSLLTFGYRAEKGRRSPRKPYLEAVKYIK